MEIKNNIYSSIEQITGQYLNQKTKESTDAAAMQGMSFEDVLRQQWKKNDNSVTDGSLKFSKHAGERLRQRNITLSDEQMIRLQNGARKSGRKRHKGVSCNNGQPFLHRKHKEQYSDYGDGAEWGHR